MTRTLDQMQALCLKFSGPLGDAVEEYENLGAIIVLYQPSDIDSNEDAPVAFAASRNGDVPQVLANLLEQHFLLQKEEKGNGSHG